MTKKGVPCILGIAVTLIVIGGGIAAFALHNPQNSFDGQTIEQSLT